MRESGLEGKRRLGSAAFTPSFCVWNPLPPPQQGTCRAWSAPSGRFLPGAPDGLFRFRKVSRDPGPAGRLLVFWGSSGFRRKEGFTNWMGLAGQRLFAPKRSFAPQPRKLQVPSSQPRQPVAGVSSPHPSSGSCALQAGWPVRRLPRKSCRLLVLGGVE